MEVFLQLEVQRIKDNQVRVPLSPENLFDLLMEALKAGMDDYGLSTNWRPICAKVSTKFGYS